MSYLPYVQESIALTLGFSALAVNPALAFFGRLASCSHSNFINFSHSEHHIAQSDSPSSLGQKRTTRDTEIPKLSASCASQMFNPNPNQ